MRPPELARRRSAEGDGVAHIFLVPTPKGIWRSLVCSRVSPAAHRVMTALLCGAASAMARVDALGAVAGIGDERSLRMLLSGMQRDGWLSGESSPLAVPDAPARELLPQLLAGLSGVGRALLADGQGFCLAAAGWARADAGRLAAMAAAFHPLARRYRGDQAESIVMLDTALRSGDAAHPDRLTVFPLHLGDRRLLLAVAGPVDLRTEHFVQLAALLSRRAFPALKGGDHDERH